MQITSHFVGVTLNKLLFGDLFVDLQAYLKMHSVENCIALQNPLSPHITLYYLPKDLTETEIIKIKDVISTIRSATKLNLYIDGFDYFKKNEEEYLCYLYPSEHIELEQINRDFREAFPNTVLDNTHSFIPHISLFKIKDFGTFINHKPSIEEILEKHLSYIQNTNSFTEFNLYSVNSHFEPQIQIIMY